MPQKKPARKAYSREELEARIAELESELRERRAAAVKEKRDEEALRESEQRYRTLFEKNRNPIAIIDTAGRYLDANPAFLELVEKPYEQLMRMQVFDFAPPGLKPLQEETHIPKWDSGGSVETEYWVNGRIKIVELTITPIRYKGVDAAIGVGKNITERRRAEDSLRLEHARFAAVMDALDAGVYVADMETYDLLFMNARARKTFGDHVGKKCWEAIQPGQTGPCPLCTNDKLIDPDGEPAAPYIWKSRAPLMGDGINAGTRPFAGPTAGWSGLKSPPTFRR